MEENCAVCYKIICRKCPWEPTSEEVVAIQDGRLTSCPDCGWAPGSQSL